MIRKGETLFLQATCEPDEQPHEGVGLKPCREVPAWNATPLKITRTDRSSARRRLECPDRRASAAPREVTFMWSVSHYNEKR
jgi:hypothetical protein